MEIMPYRDEHGIRPSERQPVEAVVATGWRAGASLLNGETVVLRELRQSDASSLLAMLSTEEVSRFISPPPTSVEGFERFITWTHRQRAAGTYVCFAVTIRGFDTAIGIFQIRALDEAFGSAEWGFAIGSPFWGQGVFQEAAALVLDFTFDTLGTHRLEARAAVVNGRGQGALRKLGAVQEALLRHSLRRGDTTLDQLLYTILAEEWRARRAPVSTVRKPLAGSLSIH